MENQCYLLILMVVVAFTSSHLGGAQPCGPPKEGQDYQAMCTDSLRRDSEVCSGHGTCICGQCDCHPIRANDPTRRWSGRYCQCNDYSCDFYDGKICGGPTRGQCQCGDCVCTKDYQGEACACPQSRETCRAANGKICNGKGKCVCGRCVCQDTYYRGNTCEDCPTCPGRCERHKACVQCVAYGSGSYSREDCQQKCSHIYVVDEVQETPDRRRCRFRDDDGCSVSFAYDFDGPNVYAHRTKECPRPATTPASGAVYSSWSWLLLVLIGTGIYSCLV